ncbi:MAG: HPF/RaiA family ribosome-associated protein, partial [Clostridia bacterium]|nr:HPF/RaiA family ribosome-associated protein [Clostridia bacterium]
QKLDKFFCDDPKTEVRLSRLKTTETVEITIFSGSTIFRAETESKSFKESLDKSIDILQRQIRKNKTRLEKRISPKAFEDKFDDVVEEEGEYKISEKHFEMAPMPKEEAILRMNLLGHTFFVFRDVADGLIKTAYLKKDGSYGIIIPE